MAVQENEPVNVIVGLGDTGLSVAHYFAHVGEAFMVVDTRENPPGLAELNRLYPDVRLELGAFRLPTFLAAKQLVVSPGLSLKTTEIVAAIEAGVPVTGDIDIFSKNVTAPIIAVTGSNGKSTVVAIVAAILRSGGIEFGLGGNLDGANFKPALDLLREERKQLYVLELSSFQLETTENLQAEVAVILNVSPDHMDRYVDIEEYRAAKQRIFRGCKQVVVNVDEPTSTPPAQHYERVWEFGLESATSGVGIVRDAGKDYVALDGNKLLPVNALKIVGQHNLSNVLAAVALTLAVGIDKQVVCEGLQSFKGLPHRCQWVATINDVDFYNDSKGTNVGATIAAVKGLGLRVTGKVILIAGGIGKGADFSGLTPVVAEWVKALVLIGQDAELIAAQVATATPKVFASDMPSAVAAALAQAVPGDAVLLSPACASFDMFSNFQHRGQVFMNAVENLQ